MQIGTENSQLAAHRRGSVVVYVAIFLVFLLGLLGLGLDAARVYLAAQELQTAADSAAMAGVPHLEETDPDAPGAYPSARLAAQTAAQANEAAGSPVQLAENSTNVTAGDIVVGYWDFKGETFIPLDYANPQPATPNAIKVVARRTSGSLGGSVPLVFGPMFGLTSAEVARTTIAIRGAPPDPTVFVLDPSSNGAMTMTGDAVLSVDEGVVQINSSHNHALFFAGASATVTASRIQVAGSSNNTQTPNLYPGSSPVADYLTVLPFPAPPYEPAPSPNPTQITGAGTYDPGYYAGGISASGGEINLRPGKYVFGHPGIDILGNTVVQSTAPGVTIFLLKQDATWSPGGNATLKMLGSSSFRIDPPEGPFSGTYQGISVYHQPGNAAELSVGGTGVFDMKGVLYSPNGTLKLSGTGSITFGAINVWNLNVSGTGQVTAEDVPPGKTAKSVYLVE